MISQSFDYLMKIDLGSMKLSSTEVSKSVRDKQILVDEKLCI